MFKDFRGFDTSVLTFKTPVEILDRKVFNRRSVDLTGGDEGGNPYFKNISGVYIVKESGKEILTLTNVYGKEVKLNVEYFTEGIQPRMEIKILK